MSEKEKMTNLKVVLNTTPKKATRTSVDTIVITPEIVKRWKNPPFQRPLRVNEKVRSLAEELKTSGGVLPGVITLGVLNREEFLLDGQHRREAFLLAKLEEGFTDVRKHFFDSMADMGAEFVDLNSSLVHLRPDDMLRGLEGTIPALARIREECKFVGYDMIRRGANAPMVSMSALLRTWCSSAAEVPAAGGTSAVNRALQLTEDEASNCITFLKIAIGSWGRDPEYVRLWGALNMTLCMWLYRHTVLTQHSAKSARLTASLFGKCLMSLSATTNYLEWLQGRNLSERDRSPAYQRIKTIFQKRLETELGKKATLPAPSWSSNLSRQPKP